MHTFLQRGLVPKGWHVEFRIGKDGKEAPYKLVKGKKEYKGGRFIYEEIMNNNNFGGDELLLYHLHRPAEIIPPTELVKRFELKERDSAELRMWKFSTAKIKPKGDVVLDRIPLLFNNDVTIWFSAPTKTQELLYRNTRYELYFVHDGSGVLETPLGDIKYRAGDDIIVPRGGLHRLRLDDVKHRFLIIEPRSTLVIPNHYKNRANQSTQLAPYQSIHFRRPEFKPAIDKRKPTSFLVKNDDAITKITVTHDPNDIIGWYGNLYPVVWNMENMNPTTQKFHTPPPRHQIFGVEDRSFVVCHFAPRMFDWGPNAIPAPYHHYNDAAEVLFYTKGNFMSKKGLERGDMTMHPSGLTHGPHPGISEASMKNAGKLTVEDAVMIDTVRQPLKVTVQAMEIENSQYPGSWLEGEKAEDPSKQIEDG